MLENVKKSSTCSTNNWHYRNAVILSPGDLGPQGVTGIICGHFWLSHWDHATGIPWGEFRDAAKHPVTHGTTSTTNNPLAPYVHTIKAENPALRLYCLSH